jgi:hypothetical protein
LSLDQQEEVTMRRPLFAVLLVLVAASFASGHSAAQGSKSVKTPAKTPAKPPVQKLESVMACMKYRQQRLVEDGGLRMELRNCCHGPVKCAVSWEVRCGRDGKPDAKSADLEIAAGSTESAFGYGTECGNDGWRISSVKWNCETAAAADGPDDR